MKHLLKISSGKNADERIEPYRLQLWLRGFRYERSTNAWVKPVGNIGASQNIRYAKERGLRYELLDKNVKRNTSYKAKWVRENPPFLGMYLCTYCGRLVFAKNITVDHIVSVGQASTSLRYARSGKNVNDIENLCGACSSCNSIKDAKGGLWVLRGKIYRHRSMRIMRFLFRLCIVAALVYGAIRLWDSYPDPGFLSFLHLGDISWIS
ncbi:MAG: HNH endonuclease [Lachnospiraceae bacterium]|nr:HNH endonuclease [Lachnospiraceae bacterium]